MTAAPDRDELDALDCVHELTERIVHRERYTLETTSKRGHRRRTSRYHETEHPSLLEQLLDAVDPSRSAEEGAGIARPYGSAAAARLDAIDAALRIDHAAAAWLRFLGENDPGDTIVCVRRLGPHLDNNLHLANDVRRWRTWARVLTGWDSPAWRPDNTCPPCGERGTLRVRLDKRSGVCINCWEAWDPESVGLLADHIRAENDAEKPTRALVAVYGTCPTCHTPNILRQRQDGLGLQYGYGCPHGHAAV